MEFRYRAGDNRPRPPPPPAPSGVFQENGVSHDGGVQAETGAGQPPPSVAGVMFGASQTYRDPAIGLGSQSLLPPTPFVTSPAIRELQRQLEKERIREQIMRQEFEKWALEAEVRREAIERLLTAHAGGTLRSLELPALSSAHPRPSNGCSGSTGTMHVEVRAGAAAADTGEAPVRVIEAMQVQPETPITSTASLARRKKADSAASSLSATTSYKQPKLDLTCALCCVTVTSQKAMEEHLIGKMHKKKTMLVQPTAELEHKEEEEEEEEAVAVAVTGSYVPMKIVMRTNIGTMDEVVQMEGYLLCEPCNVTAADRVTMMCHLEGSKHAKSRKLHQACKEPAEDEAATKRLLPVGVAVNATKKTKMETTVPVAVPVGDSQTVAVEVDGVVHAVRQSLGYLACDICNTKAPSQRVMLDHLGGKKHKSRARTAGVAAGESGAQGKDAVTLASPLVQAKAKGTPVADTAQVKGSVPVIELAEGEVAVPLATQQAKARENGTAQAKAAMDISNSTTLARETMKIGGTAAKEMKIQVEGTVYTVLDRENGWLSCEVCGEHCHDKDSMVMHLCTRKHTGSVRVAKGEKQAEAVVVDKDAVAAATKGMT